MKNFILSPNLILPIRPSKQVLKKHSLLIENGKITKIFLSEEKPDFLTQLDEIALPNHLVMPGLINLHGHTAMTLLRGLADDLPLKTWLEDHIWPVEGRLLSHSFVQEGTLLGMTEMLKGGTTTIADMYFYWEAIAEAAVSSGMRASIGCALLDFPTTYAPHFSALLEKSETLYHTLKGKTRLKSCLAPHAPYTVSDKSFTQLLKVAEKLDIGLHCHLHETEQELSGEQRPFSRLEALGCFQHPFLAAHMVYSNEEERDKMAAYNVSIAHNPSSNLKLGSGIAPIADSIKAGINVGLGTDSAASNNRLDMWTEMRTAALLAKGSTQDPTVLPAWQVLEMATLNGAKALGWEKEIGSLEVGKSADIIAIDLSAPELQPIYDPLSALVYSVGREHVTHVWVEGECLVKNKMFTRPSLTSTSNIPMNWKEIIQSCK